MEDSNKIRNDRGDIKTDALEIQDYYEELDTNKLDNLRDMDKFLRNIQPTKTES